MAIRATAESVAAIIEVDESISLDPFIAAASSLVDRVRDYAVANSLLADGTEDGDKTREEKLEEIETWLAAHFYTVRDPRPVSEGAGPVSTSYQSRVDLRLFTSHYGQMAAMLDETGILEEINKGKGITRTRRVGVHWLGKTSEEIQGERGL